MPYYRNKQGLLPASGQVTMRIDNDSGDNGDPGFKPDPRFISIGEGGIVHDRATGRMWITDQRKIVPGSVTAAMASVPRGTWSQSSVSYNVGDVIWNDIQLKFYICLIPHVSGSQSWTSEIADGRWVYTPWVFGDATSWNVPWVSGCFATVSPLVDGLDYGGYSDWRIPTQLELTSIIDWERDGYIGDSAWFYADSIKAPNDQTIWTCNVLASDTDFVCQYGPENTFSTAHYTGPGVALAVRGG